MAQDERNAQLLRIISAALGVNTAVFSDGQCAAPGAPDDYHAAVLLIRLVRAFHTLPNDDKRLELLRLVEKFAAEMSPDTSAARP